MPPTRIPKSVPLRLMAVTMEDPATPRAGSMIALPMTMARLRKNWSLPPMKARMLASLSRPSTARARAGAISRRKRPVQPTLRWCISSPIERPRATIPLRARPPLCLSAAASAGPRISAIQRRRASTSVVVAAEAHHFAEALVEGRVGAVAEGSILDHHHRHGTGDQPGHRADGVEVVIGPERQGSRGGKGGGLFEVRCPALEDGGAGDGAAQGAAHPVPADGRPGVQHHAVLEAPDRLARWAHVDQHRLGTEDALQGLGVRPLDEIEGVQRRQQAAQTLVATGRRRPVHLDHRHALRREILGESLKPDVDHRERRAQQFVDPHASLVEAISVHPP